MYSCYYDIGIEAIDAIDRDAFRRFCYSLIPLQHSRDADFMEHVVCILLMYYPAIKDDYENHVLVQSMETVSRQCGLDTPATLQLWSKQSRRWFVRRNNIWCTLSAQDINDETTIPVSSVAGFMRQSSSSQQHNSNSLMELQSLLSEVLHNQQLQLRNEETAKAERQEILERILGLENRLGHMEQVIFGSGVIGNSPSVAVSSITTMVPQSRPPSQVQTSLRMHFPITVAPTIPSRRDILLDSLKPPAKGPKSILCSTLWINWYQHKLYDNAQNYLLMDIDKKIKQSARSQLLKAARLIFYMKLFITEPTTIDSFPDNIEDTSNSRSNWTARIERLGNTLQSAIVEFVYEIKTRNATPSAKSKIKRPDGYFMGVQKYLSQLALTDSTVFFRRDTSHVTDNATCADYLYTTFNDLRLVTRPRKRKQGVASEEVLGQGEEESDNEDDEVD